MDDDIIPRIKFIGKIQKGEKINVKHMNIQQDSIMNKIIRSFIHTDTRANTIGSVVPLDDNLAIDTSILLIKSLKSAMLIFIEEGLLLLVFLFVFEPVK